MIRTGDNGLAKEIKRDRIRSGRIRGEELKRKDILYRNGSGDIPTAVVVADGGVSAARHHLRSSSENSPSKESFPDPVQKRANDEEKTRKEIDRVGVDPTIRDL